MSTARSLAIALRTGMLTLPLASTPNSSAISSPGAIISSASGARPFCKAGLTSGLLILTPPPKKSSIPWNRSGRASSRLVPSSGRPPIFGLLLRRLCSRSPLSGSNNDWKLGDSGLASASMTSSTPIAIFGTPSRTGMPENVFRALSKRLSGGVKNRSTKGLNSSLSASCICPAISCIVLSSGSSVVLF